MKPLKSLFRINFLKLHKLFFANDKFFIFVLLLLFLGIIFTVIGLIRIKIAESPYPKTGGIYREGIYEAVEPLNLAKINENNITQKSILNILFPPFVEFDNGKIRSRFFDSYKISNDKLTYTFYLKNNLRWSDGALIDIDDFLFSFNLLQKTNPGLLLDKVTINMPDRKTVIFTLPNNDNYFLYNLKNFRIFPRQFASFDSLNQLSFNDLKVSSGPFVFEKIETKNDITILTLTRNLQYQPQPYLDKIVFYSYSSVRKAFDALVLKEIDGLGGVNYFSLPSNIHYDYNIYKIIMPRVVGIFFNKAQVNEEVIDYLSKAINRQELVKNVFKDYAEATSKIFSPSLRKILLIKDQAVTSTMSSAITFKDYKNTSTLILTVDSSYLYPDIARYLQEKFNFIKIQFTDKNNLNKLIAEKKYSALLTGIFFDHLPNLVFFSSAGLNINNHQSLAIEEKLQRFTQEANIDLSQELADLENLILKLKANIFLVNPYYIYFISKDFYNFDQSYLFDASSRFVKIEQWFKK
ncbi:MAG: peptide ABC transporter substrate-binding protein [Candidatus Parcubacteria bacterium]|nr:MAG: peptide ABC transporter substrate-binding protein [Candidatus Parcubacteria bacterium]